MFFWIIVTILLLTGASCLGIFLSRQNKSIKNFTNKNQTILFLAILSIIVFVWDIKEDGSVAHALGFVLGYVYLFSVPCSFIAVFLLNKFKNNPKEIWPSLFFSLIIICVVFINQSFLGN
tara:strand:- start:292 stop:651 length:360 start_codon:yes stop_codon:yes gene_type:complete